MSAVELIREEPPPCLGRGGYSPLNEASVLGIPVFRLVGEVALIVSFVAEWHERRMVGL